MIVVAYDPGWPKLFRFLRDRIAGALDNMASAIEHVGSTAVPGMAAKPIIDIGVPLVSGVTFPEAIERLAGIGYVHQGILRTAEREAFRAPVNDPQHHLYVCPPKSAEFRRHIALRDYLRSHPERCQGLLGPEDCTRSAIPRKPFCVHRRKKRIRDRTHGSRSRRHTKRSVGLGIIVQQR
jgi:GrpB-like predicted nucleotidyltransferase (UPF0157 family)